MPNPNNDPVSNQKKLLILESAGIVTPQSKSTSAELAAEVITLLKQAGVKGAENLELFNLCQIASNAFGRPEDFYVEAANPVSSTDIFHNISPSANPLYYYYLVLKDLNENSSLLFTGQRNNQTGIMEVSNFEHSVYLTLVQEATQAFSRNQSTFLNKAVKIAGECILDCHYNGASRDELNSLKPSYEFKLLSVGGLPQKIAITSHASGKSYQLAIDSTLVIFNQGLHSAPILKELDALPIRVTIVEDNTYANSVLSYLRDQLKLTKVDVVSSSGYQYDHNSNTMLVSIRGAYVDARYKACENFVLENFDKRTLNLIGSEPNTLKIVNAPQICQRQLSAVGLMKVWAKDYISRTPQITNLRTPHLLNAYELKDFIQRPPLNEMFSEFKLFGLISRTSLSN